MAEGFNVNCEVGTAGNSLMNAANLNVIMSVLNCDFYEYWSPLEAQQFGLTEEILVNDRLVPHRTRSRLGLAFDDRRGLRRQTSRLDNRSIGVHDKRFER